MIKRLALLTLIVFPWQSLSGYVRITTSVGATPRWVEAAIPYSISDAGSPQIPNGSEFLAVAAAFDAWEGVASSNVNYEYQGTTPIRTAGRDGTNLITFVDDTGLGALLGTTTLAATFSFFNSVGGELVFEESDIPFNPSHVLTTSGESDRFHIQSVMTHEVGHMLGLDHSGLISSVMAPFAIQDQTDQRVLLYDDIAGVTEIYPDPISTLAVGVIQGSVTSNGADVFGAHVVAMDSGGTVVTSTMSARDGTYTIRLLPVGDYRVYAEPLDQPVSSQHIPGFYSTLNTDFGTTYYGDTRFQSEASTVGVSSGGTSSGTDIHVLPAPISGFNLTRPVFALRIGSGSSETLRVGGAKVVDGVSFSVSTPLIRFDSVTFGGRLSTTAPTSATLETVVDPVTPVGPKNVTGESGSDTSVVSGGIVVTNPPPADIEVSPTSGFFDGGTPVTISGRDFRAGIRVFFAGLPAENVEFLNSGLIQATVPANSPGPANLQLFNTDGTAGFLENAFDYEAPPPTVSGVEPATLVVINGNNFFTRKQNVVVSFNGVRARTVSSTQTQVETVVPFGATTGPLTVSVFGVEADAGTFTVTEPEPSENTAPAIVAFVDASVGAGGTVASFPVQPRDGCVSSRDDGIYFFDLPFSFSLFTDTFLSGTPVSIATNGWISLGGTSFPEFQNAGLPADTVVRPSGGDGVIPPALIAPFFDDLILCGGASVTTRVTGSAPNRRFIVQWSGVSILDEVGEDLDADLTFELILYEGSNDVRFVYKSMTGALSDGAGATIGMQNLLRDRAVQSGFDQSIVGTGTAVTYSFDGGAYLEERTDSTPPGTPVVSDGGARVASLSELLASWTTETATSSAVEFDYAIGSIPGGTDVRDFTTVQSNSVVASGLPLEDGEMYYFSVRARNATGLVSEAGVSDGILIDTSFVSTISVFPSVSELEGSFGGLALLAEIATDVVLRAVNTDGSLPMGLGIRNPTTIGLEPGQQWARLVSEIFGLSGFDGWIELEASENSLRAYTATGANDLSEFDGASPAVPATDFFFFHSGGSAILINPSLQSVTATITNLDTQQSSPLDIPPRSRRTTPLAAPVRITAATPIAGVERFGTDGNLGLGESVAEPGSSLIFPHAVVGGGYRSWISLANPSSAPSTVSITFGSRTSSLQLAGRVATRVSLGELFPLSATEIETDAVRVDASGLFSGGNVAAVIDIETDQSVVTIAPVREATAVVFPHVANENGFFTGIAIAASVLAAEVTIEVFDASGMQSGSGVVSVPANGHVARLLSEFIPGFGNQSGGYIRLTSDQPVAAWEIYGTAAAMASGPPL